MKAKDGRFDCVVAGVSGIVGMHDATVFFCLGTSDPGVEIQIPDDLLRENGWVIGPQG
jgi:hypothetical protein